jgi:hypothetical protein
MSHACDSQDRNSPLEKFGKLYSLQLRVSGALWSSTPSRHRALLAVSPIEQVERQRSPESHWFSQRSPLHAAGCRRLHFAKCALQAGNRTLTDIGATEPPRIPGPSRRRRARRVVALSHLRRAGSEAVAAPIPRTAERADDAALLELLRRDRRVTLERVAGKLDR